MIYDLGGTSEDVTCLCTIAGIWIGMSIMLISHPSDSLPRYADGGVSLSQ